MGIEHFDFSYLMYWAKQGRGIENSDFSIPFSYTGLYFIPRACILFKIIGTY